MCSYFEVWGYYHKMKKNVPIGKEHLKKLNLTIYFVGIIAILPIFLFLIHSFNVSLPLADSTLKVIDNISMFFGFVISLFFLFWAYLAMFKNISMEGKKGFVILKERNTTFYSNVFIFLIAGLFLFFYSIQHIWRFFA